jgi:hypothetical protein
MRKGIAIIIYPPIIPKMNAKMSLIGPRQYRITSKYPGKNSRALILIESAIE